MRKWLPASRELPEGSVQTAMCYGASSSQQTSSTRTTMGLSATDPSFGLVECVCSCSASSAEVYRSFSDAQWRASRLSPFCEHHGFRGTFHGLAKVARESA